MTITIQVVASLLAIIGFALLIARKKRKFDRTNSSGIEQFSGFWSMISKCTADFCLLISGLLCASIGVVTLAHLYLESWGWIVLVPLYAFLLIGYIPTGSNRRH